MTTFKESVRGTSSQLLFLSSRAELFRVVSVGLNFFFLRKLCFKEMLLFLGLLLDSILSVSFHLFQEMMILFFCGQILSPNHSSNYDVLNVSCKLKFSSK